MTEKTLEQIKIELDIEENGVELSPISAQKKQIHNSALRQVTNSRTNAGSAQKKKLGIFGSPQAFGLTATQELLDLLNACVHMLVTQDDLVQQNINLEPPQYNEGNSEVLIDQLYKLLDETTKEVLIQLTTYDAAGQNEMRIRLDTSLVSIFLNRCHLSFKQMMFENLAQLKESMSLFIQGKPYEYYFAPMLFEQWIEEKAQKIETESTHMKHAEQLANIEAVTRDAKRDKNFHMKHLLTSLTHTFAKNDQQAVDDLHKYFDYNMR